MVSISHMSDNLFLSLQFGYLISIKFTLFYVSDGFTREGFGLKTNLDYEYITVKFVKLSTVTDLGIANILYRQVMPVHWSFMYRSSIFCGPSPSG